MFSTVFQIKTYDKWTSVNKEKMLMFENVEKIQKALVAELSELKRKIKCYQLVMEFEAIFGFLFSVIWCVVLRSTECSGRCRFRMDPRARAVKTTHKTKTEVII